MSKYGFTDRWGRYVEAGDIALDLNNTGTYDYGIITHGDHTGEIEYQPQWTLPQASDGFNFNSPGDVVYDKSKVVGTAKLAYVNANADDKAEYSPGGYIPAGVYPVPTYVIEVRIQKSIIGYPKVGQESNIHVTIGCGNDVIELKPVKFKSDIPEFPSIVLPVAAIMGIILIMGRRKNE